MYLEDLVIRMVMKVRLLEMKSLEKAVLFILNLNVTESAHGQP